MNSGDVAEAGFVVGVGDAELPSDVLHSTASPFVVGGPCHPAPKPGLGPVAVGLPTKIAAAESRSEQGSPYR